MSPSIPYNEGLLLRQIAEGNEKSFSILVDHHWNNIYSMSLAYLKSSTLAQDIVQDVFLKVWLKREELPQIKDFNSWLFILARNALLSALRTSKRQANYGDSLLDDLVEPNQSPDRYYDYKQLNELLQQAIEQLSPQQKLVFQLSHEQGLSHEEICERLGIARQTLKNHLVRAMITLRTYIQSNGEWLIVAFVFVRLLPLLVFFTINL
jgi:RNA polymerase sigma-70 factor (ECF subfamily)